MTDDLIAKLGIAGFIVAGLLYFISQVMKALWVPRKIHDEIVALHLQRWKDEHDDAVFWKSYSLRRDDDLRTNTEATRTAIETAKKVLEP